jgi:hypothetical protein
MEQIIENSLIAGCVLDEIRTHIDGFGGHNSIH